MKKHEIVNYLSGEDDPALWAQAGDILLQHCGNKVIIRGLIEFSSYCCRNCVYCGLRRENQKLKRYRMSVDDIIEQACEIGRQGIGTTVLQSGDDFFYERDMIEQIIKGIKKEFPDMAVTLSLGERSLDDYSAFKDGGADRYLLKHETINPKLYHQLHPGQEFARRIDILEHLKKIGFQVGVGNIIGLPGQTLKDLADDIIFIRDFEPDMIGIGPFMPQENTPLANHQSPEIKTVLRFLALARIVSLNAHIPATTAVGSLDKDQGASQALKAGANVIMANFTPSRFRPEYRIYDDKNAMDYYRCCDIIFDSGRDVSLERGDSLVNSGQVHI